MWLPLEATLSASVPEFHEWPKVVCGGGTYSPGSPTAINCLFRGNVTFIGGDGGRWK